MQKPSHQPRTFNPALTSARRDSHLEQPRVAQEEMLIYIGKGAGTSPFFGFPGIWASGAFPKTTKASKRKILLLPSLSWLLLWTSMTYMSTDIDITFIQTSVLWIFMSFSCVWNLLWLHSYVCKHLGSHTSDLTIHLGVPPSMWCQTFAVWIYAIRFKSQINACD